MSAGISLNLENNNYLQMAIVPDEVEDKLTAKSLMRLIQVSYHGWVVFEHEIAELVKRFQSADPKSTESLTARIAEAIDFKLEFKISDDELSAKVQLTTPQGGKQATSNDIITACKAHGIVRGISSKLIARLVAKASSQPPGVMLEEVIARGLPARNGKHSKAIPLFENLIEQFRAPQEESNGKVDMRDFGEITSVEPGQTILKFRPPTHGRSGYTVLNKPILAREGEWKSKKIGKGTCFSEDCALTVHAEIEGIPKFDNGIVSVDDTYTSQGCNVKTGNIVYEGNVLINGDVTDGMKIDVTGDIVVNGYVESATLIAKGDITITQGATGKMNEELTQSTTLINAGGDIHVQQGRGLLLVSNGSVSIARQLAFSNIDCKGDVIAGPVNNPNGSIFASDIRAMGKVRAGKLGAVSGSKLSIDFGESHARLMDKKARLNIMLEQLQANLVKYRKTLELSEGKMIPESYQAKFKQLRTLLRKQQQSLQVVENTLEKTDSLLKGFDNMIGVESYQKLYCGVQISFGKLSWHAEDDKNRAKVSLQHGRWQYEPML